jgi:hypothetical protein
MTTIKQILNHRTIENDLSTTKISRILEGFKLSRKMG